MDKNITHIRSSIHRIMIQRVLLVLACISIAWQSYGQCDPTGYSAGSITGPSEMCVYEPYFITSTQDASGGSFTYVWEVGYLVNGEVSYYPLSGGEIGGGTGYDLSTLGGDGTTWVRRGIVYDAGCDPLFTSDVQILIHPAFQVYEVSEFDPDICYNGDLQLRSSSIYYPSATSITYSWEKSLTDPAVGATWVAAGWSYDDGTNYQFITEPLTQDTWFRMQASATGIACQVPVYTEPVLVDVIEIAAGEIAVPSNFCAGDNLFVTNVVGASGNGFNEPEQYFWEWAIEYANGDLSGWTYVGHDYGMEAFDLGAFSSPYLSANEIFWFRRGVNSPGCGPETVVYTDPVVATMYPAFFPGEAYINSYGDQFNGVLCSGSQVELKCNNETINSSITYEWEVSNTNPVVGANWVSAGWSNDDGLSENFISDQIINDTWFRRASYWTESPCGSPKYTEPFKVEVLDIYPGSISGPTAFCAGDVQSIASVEDAYGDVTIEDELYFWEWTTEDINGTLSYWRNEGITYGVESFDLGAFSAPYLNSNEVFWFRRGIRSPGCSSIESTFYSNPVRSEMFPSFHPGAIYLGQYPEDPSDPVCNGIQVQINGDNDPYDDPSMIYSWEKSLTDPSFGATWVNAAWAEDDGNDFNFVTDVLTQDTWFRRIKTWSSSPCGAIKYSEPLFVDVFIPDPGTISASSYLCIGLSDVVSNVSTPSGDLDGAEIFWEKTNQSNNGQPYYWQGIDFQEGNLEYDLTLEDSPGTYWFRRGVFFPGCAPFYSNVVSVDLHYMPDAPELIIDEYFVFGPQYVTLDVASGIGGPEYGWFASEISTDPLFTGSSINVYFSETTQLFVRSIDTEMDPCSKSISDVVTINVLPALNITTTTDVITDPSGAVLSVYAGFDSYSWKKDGTEIGTASNLHVDHPGTYTIEVIKSGQMASSSIEIKSNRVLWAVSNGDWDNTAIWSYVEAGSPSPTFPVKGDLVKIKGSVVHVYNEQFCSGVDIISNDLDTRLIVRGSGDLSVYGEINIQKENGATLVNENKNLEIYESGSIQCLID